MIRHFLIEEGFNYPVGLHIEENLLAIKEMTDALYLLIDEHYKDCNYVDLICRGSSGAIIAGIISFMLASLIEDKKITIYHIKKEGESSHAYLSFPKNFSNRVRIVVDDFIITGATIQAILDKNEDGGELDILCVSGTIPDKFEDDFIHGICKR